MEHKIKDINLKQWLTPSNVAKINYDHSSFYLRLGGSLFINHIENVFACAEGEKKGIVYFSESETVNGRQKQLKLSFDFARTKWLNQRTLIEKKWLWKDSGNKYDVNGMLFISNDVKQ